jgi:hypothetical protein
VSLKETILKQMTEAMKDMGRVMKTVMAKVAGSADGKVVNETVRKQLSGD